MADTKKSKEEKSYQEHLAEMRAANLAAFEKKSKEPKKSTTKEVK